MYLESALHGFVGLEQKRKGIIRLAFRVLSKQLLLGSGPSCGFRGVVRQHRQQNGSVLGARDAAHTCFLPAVGSRYHNDIMDIDSLELSRLCILIHGSLID